MALKQWQGAVARDMSRDNDGDDVLGAVWEAPASPWGDHDPGC